MDVVNPPLEEIDGAMYRMNIVEHSGFGAVHDGVYMEDEPLYMNEEGEDYCDAIDSSIVDIPPIEKNNRSKGYGSHQFQTQFSVPKALHGFLIGTRGQTKQRIENESRTRIVIPKKDEEGDIVVTGCTEKSVAASYLRIRTIISQGRKILSPTHFVSIPLNAPNIREKFEVFKHEVLECCGRNDEINDELFTIAEKLHLTVSVLTLLDERERATACRRLDQCRDEVIMPLLKNQAIGVRIRGIDIMNDDPTQTKILYAKVESKNDMLQRLADEVNEYFKRDGLSGDCVDRDHVKLHVTLMNTSFLNSEDEESNLAPRRRNRRKFDATKILQNFENFDFGEVTVNNMHLSQMHAYSEDGYYLPSNRIKWA